MSSKSFAARFGCILSQTPEGEGLSDAQVQEFLELYDQVPSTVKADKQQLQGLLNESKDIARSIDDNVMPRYSIIVQGFSFKPPSIISDIPCQLEFRILPGSGQQIISILEKGTNKTLETSGILHPDEHSTFTTTICCPGSFVFTSEVYPFMSGQVTAVLNTQSSETEPPALLMPDSWAAGADSPRLAAKGAHNQQQAVSQKAASTHDGHVAGLDVGKSAPPAASGAMQPANSPAAQLECQQSGSKRVSDSADGILLQPSEAGMLELLSLPSALQQCPAQQYVSYDKQLSRSGCRARRATWYDDDLDREVQSQTKQEQLSSPVEESCANLAAVSGTAAAALANSRASSPPGSITHSLPATAAASITSAGVDTASECACKIAHVPRTVCITDPVDMDLNVQVQHAQQQEQILSKNTDHSTFAKGLESLGTSFFSLGTVSGDVTADEIHQPAAQVAVGTDASSEDPQSESSYDSACVAAMYEPLPSNSDQHSSSCSDGTNSDVALQSQGGHRGCNTRSLGEGVHLLAEVSDKTCGEGASGTRIGVGYMEDQPGVDQSSSHSETESEHTASGDPADVRLARWHRRQQGKSNVRAVNQPVYPAQEPPGAKWTLGGKPSFTAVGAGRQSRSTFTSTGDLPDCSRSSAGHMSSGTSCSWRTTGGLGLGVHHDSQEQATVAAAAGVEEVSNAGVSYFNEHVLGSRLAGPTVLGPGTYLLGGRSGSSSACLENGISVSKWHKSSIVQQHDGQGLPRVANEAPGVLDSEDEPDEVRIRAQRLLHQQQAVATAAAKRASHHQQQSSSITSSSTGAAASSRLTANNKKKKGRKVIAAATSVPEVREKAAADARRREREEVEYAMWDKGSSQGNSEDEVSMLQPQSGRLSAAAAGKRHGDNAMFSSTTEAARQLTKCRFKSCKLMFASDLNKQRCHLSHLPSARNTTTKLYKAEVLSFLKALPRAAFVQLLQLPEPSQLPKRRGQLQELMQQYSRSSKAGSLILAAATSTRAAAIDRLQGMSLADAWFEQSTLSDDVTAEHSGALLMMSELAQVCCMNQMGPSDDEAANQGGTSGCSASDALKLEQPSDTVSAAAAALAAAHVEAIHGACCSRCSSETARIAVKILGCTCSCHSQLTLQSPSSAWPALDNIIALLERGSEGTWLCNPRMLQQPHPTGCCCSVCVQSVTADKAGGKAGGQQIDFCVAVMDSISSGLDVLEIFGEWNVDDASLSYAVERRLVTAFHKAKDAEARRVMNLLLEDTESSTKPACQQQPQAAVATAGRKKDKKKAVKASRAAVNQGPRKVPAWKAACSNDEYSTNDTEQQHSSAIDTVPTEAPAGDPEQQVFGCTDEPVHESPSKGKYVAEQLLQARLLQQDQELQHMRNAQQHQQDQNQEPEVQLGKQCNVSSYAEEQQSQQQPKWQVKQPSGQAFRSVGPLQQNCPAAQQLRMPAAAALPKSGHMHARGPADGKPAASGQRPIREFSQPPAHSQTLHRLPAPKRNTAGAAGTAAVLVVPRRSATTSSRQSKQQVPALHAHLPCLLSVIDADSTALQGASSQTSQPAHSAGTGMQPKAVTVTAVQSDSLPTIARLDVKGAADVCAVETENTSAESKSHPQVSDGILQGASAQQGGSSLVPDVQAAEGSCMALTKPPPDDGHSHQTHHHQQQQQQMLMMLYDYQHHQGILLQQHCMTFAQQQAYQHVFVGSGRAAAVAAGQEISPFSAEEQQLMCQWCAYYYQHAYIAASQQLLQQQQQQRSTSDAGSSDVSLSAHGTSANGSQQQRPSLAQQQPVAVDQQMAGSDSSRSPVALQFGSFPVDFTLSPDAESKVASHNPPSKTAVTTGAVCAAAGVMSVMQKQQQHVQAEDEAPTPSQPMSQFARDLTSVMQVSTADSNRSRRLLPFRSLRICCDSGVPAACFDAQMAQEMLDDRWTAVVAEYGLPQPRLCNTKVSAAVGALQHTIGLSSTAADGKLSDIAVLTLDAASTVIAESASNAAVASIALSSAVGQGHQAVHHQRRATWRHLGVRGGRHAGYSSNSRGYGAEDHGRVGRRSSSTVWRPKQH